MKIDIYTLLGMIKDGKAPKKIIHNNLTFDYEDVGYYNSDYGFLFDNYSVEGILDDEVKILETTITYKKDDKIEKLDQTLNRIDMNDDYYRYIMENRFKINKIIDHLNNK